jgi:hypothetical protein
MKIDEYMDSNPMTATEIRFRMGESNRSMERLRQGIDETIEQLIEGMCFTPIQFRFPRSKKKRIQKKWRKDSGNFKPLLPDQFEDIEIVGTFN